MEFTLIIIIFLILAVLIAVGIGANDETFSVVYGSKILTMKQVLIFAVLLAIAGALLLGEGVAKTVGNSILASNIEVTEAIVITVLLSSAIWLIVASAFGLPISTTHATIGSIIGIGVFLWGMTGLNWAMILYLAMWWILSPVVGFFGTYFAYKILYKYKENRLNGFQDYEGYEKKFAIIVLITICITAFSRAGNDCSNAVGIVVGVGEVDVGFLLLITGLSLACGLVILGRVVIKTLGEMTELRPSTAFAAQLPTAAIMLFGTLQKVPLSGSHMLVASLVGLAKASKTPMKGGLWKIVMVWILTFPVAAILSIIIYFPVNLYF